MGDRNDGCLPAAATPTAAWRYPGPDGAHRLGGHLGGCGKHHDLLAGVDGQHRCRRVRDVSRRDAYRLHLGHELDLLRSRLRRTYSLAVDAFDAAGNHSVKAAVVAATSACPDSQPPTAPIGLVQSVTETSIGISWRPSTDNVGVIGYGVYQNGVRVATTAGTTFTFASLACGTGYTVAVDAYDASGNRSTATTMLASTSACPPPLPSITLSLATSGSDANPCTAALPCRTLDRAYRAAAPGQVVEVAAGSYPDQTITADASKTSASNVVMRPAAGATVSFSKLIVSGAKHLTLRDFKTTFWRAEQGADDVAFEQIDTGVFTIGAATNLSVLGGDVGPWDSNATAEDAQIGTGSSATPTGLVFDGVSFHDFTNNANPSAHTECLQFMEGIDVTIRNSRFQNCGGADDVYIRGDFGPVRNFLIENNFFGYTGTFSLRLSGQTAPSPPCENVLVRNNSALAADVVGLHRDRLAGGAVRREHPTDAGQLPLLDQHRCRHGVGVQRVRVGDQVRGDRPYRPGLLSRTAPASTCISSPVPPESTRALRATSHRTTTTVKAGPAAPPPTPERTRLPARFRRRRLLLHPRRPRLLHPRRLRLLHPHRRQRPCLWRRMGQMRIRAVCRRRVGRWTGRTE